MTVVDEKLEESSGLVRKSEIERRMSDDIAIPAPPTTPFKEPERLPSPPKKI